MERKISITINNGKELATVLESLINKAEDETNDYREEIAYYRAGLRVLIDILKKANG